MRLKSTFPVTIQAPFSHHSVTIQSTERWDFILWISLLEMCPPFSIITLVVLNICILFRKPKPVKCPIYSLCSHAVYTSFQSKTMTSQCMCPSLESRYFYIRGAVLWKKEENVKSWRLSRRWITDKLWSEKLTLTFDSGELKMKIQPFTLTFPCQG